MIKLVTEKRLLTLEATTKRHEKEILDLKKPQLMYRPPDSEEYETIAQTLDRLHKDIRKLMDR